MRLSRAAPFPNALKQRRTPWRISSKASKRVARRAAWIENLTALVEADHNAEPRH